MFNIKRLLIKIILQNIYKLLIVASFSMVVFYNYDNVNTDYYINRTVIEYDIGTNRLELLDVVNEYFAKRKEWNTSNLGSLLFKNEGMNTSDVQNNKIFKILIWKYQEWLSNRHVFSFSRKRNDVSALADCSVNNCVFVGDNKSLHESDAVVIHIQHGEHPHVVNRNRDQRWVFLSDESPFNAFSMAKSRPKLKDLANIFNWSMTYRSDSDVPVPYGRTIPLRKSILSHVAGTLDELVPFWGEKQRKILAAILISNCKSKRMHYLKQLKKYLSIDVHGKCSEIYKDSCPGHFRSDCHIMARYLFYLVFENSACDEYLTEKGFYNAYSKGAIPIILGPSIKNCELLLPPNSFIHVDNYKSSEELAQHIIDISENDEKLMKYHSWRNNFNISNEHGYFGSQSFHYCRICEALNYNDKAEKVYDEENLKRFLDPDISCRERITDFT